MRRRSPKASPIGRAFAAAFALAMPLAPAGNAPADPIEVRALPVALNPEKPRMTTVGKLAFMSGLELVSGEGRFGGLSGLEVSPDGRWLRAVSDRGHWITATLAHDSAGRLTGASRWRATAMLTPAGRPVRRYQRDAEGLTRLSRNAFLVSFEGRHRIWRYPPAFDMPPTPVASPPSLKDAPVNGGLEAITVLADGSVLGVTERYANGDGSLKGWFMENGAAHEIAYVPGDGFSPTDLAAMPNGDVLLLERSFNLLGMRARLVRLAKGRLQEARRRAGARLRGDLLAALERPLSVDNFEGLALRRDRAGRALLYLVSDDNFVPLQRTLLLQFRLIDDL